MAENINKINSPAERTNVVIILQANLFIKKESDYKKKNVGGKSLLILKKWKLGQLKRDSVINYNFNNPSKNSSGCSNSGKNGL